jgi:hypothetical protein
LLRLAATCDPRSTPALGHELPECELSSREPCPTLSSLQEEAR